MKKQTNLKSRQSGNELVLAEADKRFNKEVARIKVQLLTAPSRDKYIQSELDIIDRILHTPKHIKRNDYILDILKGGYKAWYFESGRFDYPVEYIKWVRHHYRLYLGGTINFIGDELTDKAKVIADAIMFYKLEEYLKELSKKKKDTDLSLIEIALIAIYEGEIITRDKGKLYQHFSKYSKRKHRINTEASLLRTQNKIAQFEKIIPLLSERVQASAIDDLETLKANLEKEPY